MTNWAGLQKTWTIQLANFEVNATGGMHALVPGDVCL
jgi:hypothetical protein